VTSTCWEKTLFIIINDEHGGTYDHVPPPTTVAPNDGSGEMGFDFRRLGVRIPAVLISPWVEPGQIIHNIYDHTSIIRSLCDRFGLTSLTKRDASAQSLASALSLSKPNLNTVPLEPIAITPSNVPPKIKHHFLELALAYQLLNEGKMEKDLDHRVRKKLKAAHIRTTEDAIKFLKANIART